MTVVLRVEIDVNEGDPVLDKDLELWLRSAIADGLLLEDADVHVRRVDQAVPA